MVDETTCYCKGLEAGVHRLDHMPLGATNSFEHSAWIEKPWESHQRCRICGQRWHQGSIASGHADIETFTKLNEA
jgi:hypothetical protein